jgi:3-hydroxyacyl-[acyl-carrier-protein] dehydratase
MTASRTLRIAPNHPAFAGHFPGRPILPGVVLLDAAVQAAAGGASEAGWQIVRAKFHHVVGPGEELTLEQQRLPDALVRFAIKSATQLVASGTLRPSAPAPSGTEPQHGE